MPWIRAFIRIAMRPLSERAIATSHVQNACVRPKPHGGERRQDHVIPAECMGIEPVERTAAFGPMMGALYRIFVECDLVHAALVPALA